MPTKFNFENLFIYDLANNHQGDLAYAKDIVRGVGRVNREARSRARSNSSSASSTASSIPTSRAGATTNM